MEDERENFLLQNGFYFNNRTGAYNNYSLKKIIGRTEKEDRPIEWLSSKIRESNITGKWQYYMATLPKAVMRYYEKNV